jgi:predicted Rossmann fold flavoprotein
MTKVAIIGGGAAGLMVAATLAERAGSSDELEIFLLEKNQDLGKKVKISGGGRCNVTTGFEDLKEVLKAYPRGSKFFRTALYGFGPEAVRAWFEERGVPLKVEKDMRVFPVSNKGEDVVAVFEKIFEESGVQVMFGTAVSGLRKDADGFVVEIEGAEDLRADKVVLTPGGQAYRHTGSQGDGYRLAEELGHSVTKLGPSLNSFFVQDDWVKNLSGVSFGDLRLRMAGQEFRGPALFTHKGVSGPAVFALSSLCAFEEITKEAPLRLNLDFCPDRSYEELGADIMKRIGGQMLGKVLAPFVTKSFVKEYALAYDLDFEKQGDAVGKRDLNKAVEMLKNAEVAVIGRLPGEEFVTAGGIELSEVDSKTMESRICPGLYFAGEILNIDGFTGGYNLQVAWATGRLAGRSL